MNAKTTFPEINVKNPFSEIRTNFENQRQEISNRKEDYPLKEAKYRLGLISTLTQRRREIDQLKKDKKSLVVEKNSMHRIHLIKSCSSFSDTIKLSWDHPILFLMSLRMEKKGQGSAQDKENECAQKISFIDEGLKQKISEIHQLSEAIGGPERTQPSQNKPLNPSELGRRLANNQFKRMPYQRKLSRLQMKMDKLTIDRLEWLALYKEIEKIPKLYRELNTMENFRTPEEIQIKKSWGIDENKDRILNQYDAKPLISSALILEGMLEISEESNPLDEEMDELTREMNDLLSQMIQT